jgi:LPS export ABC transporter protein LptC
MKGVRLCAAAAAIVLAAACRKGTNPPVIGAETLADSAEQVILDARIYLTNSGIQRGELFADTIFVFDDQTRFALRRVRSEFNTITGAPNGTLRGDRGIYDFRMKVLEGWGNVVVTSTDGRRLLSDHLRYSEATNLISSDSAFTFYRGKDVQRGIGFRSDPNISRFQCMRSCRVEADVPISSIQNP